MRPSPDVTPPKECKKNPTAPNPGLDSVPIVGPGLQQGASTAANSGNQGQGSGSNTIPGQGGQSGSPGTGSSPQTGQTPSVPGGQGGQAPGPGSIPVVGGGLDSAASGKPPQAAPPSGR